MTSGRLGVLGSKGSNRKTPLMFILAGSKFVLMVGQKILLIRKINGCDVSMCWPGVGGFI